MSFMAPGSIPLNFGASSRAALIWPRTAPCPQMSAQEGNWFRRHTEFIDFLVMNDAARARKLAGSFRETTFDTDERPSDHCPIAIGLER